jgi:hypothetical protein
MRLTGPIRLVAVNVRRRKEGYIIGWGLDGTLRPSPDGIAAAKPPLGQPLRDERQP